MKPFSFVHAADLHLGYAQYNLDVRRTDFNNFFGELVDKTIETSPNFMILAGDIFEHARPSNSTLEAAIANFRRLRDAGIPVLAVDGSHDSVRNVITSTILNPLDSPGLIWYLPRHEGASWRNESCYVYGLPNFRTTKKTMDELPAFLERNKPIPDPLLFNILVFHMALDSICLIAVSTFSDCTVCARAATSTYENFSIASKMEKTNLWQAETFGLNLVTVTVLLVLVIVILLAFFLKFKSKK